MRIKVLTKINRKPSSAFKCSLKAQKYLLFTRDDTALYFGVFILNKTPTDTAFPNYCLLL